MSEHAFVYQADIATTPERLWSALTSGELTRQYWFDRRVESDWAVGSTVLFYDGDTDIVTDTGTVLEADRPRRLVYSFQPQVDTQGAPYTGESTRVAFDLEPLAADRVRLRLVHDQLASPDDVGGWRQGWTPILANLQVFLEGPTSTAPAG